MYSFLDSNQLDSLLTSIQGLAQTQQTVQNQPIDKPVDQQVEQQEYNPEEPSIDNQPIVQPPVNNQSTIQQQSVGLDWLNQNVALNHVQNDLQQLSTMLQNQEKRRRINTNPLGHDSESYSQTFRRCMQQATVPIDYTPSYYNPQFGPIFAPTPYRDTEYMLVVPIVAEPLHVLWFILGTKLQYHLTHLRSTFRSACPFTRNHPDLFQIYCDQSLTNYNLDQLIMTNAQHNQNNIGGFHQLIVLGSHLQCHLVLELIGWLLDQCPEMNSVVGLVESWIYEQFVQNWTAVQQRTYDLMQQHYGYIQQQEARLQANINVNAVQSNGGVQFGPCLRYWQNCPCDKQTCTGTHWTLEQTWQATVQSIDQQYQPNCVSMVSNVFAPRLYSQQTSVIPIPQLRSTFYGWFLQSNMIYFLRSVIGPTSRLEWLSQPSFACSELYLFQHLIVHQSDLQTTRSLVAMISVLLYEFTMLLQNQNNNSSKSGNTSESLDRLVSTSYWEQMLVRLWTYLQQLPLNNSATVKFPFPRKICETMRYKYESKELDEQRINHVVYKANMSSDSDSYVTGIIYIPDSTIEPLRRHNFELVHQWEKQTQAKTIRLRIASNGSTNNNGQNSGHNNNIAERVLATKLCCYAKSLQHLQSILLFIVDQLDQIQLQCPVVQVQQSSYTMPSPYSFESTQNQLSSRFDSSSRYN